MDMFYETVLRGHISKMFFGNTLIFFECAQICSNIFSSDRHEAYGMGSLDKRLDLQACGHSHVSGW